MRVDEFDFELPPDLIAQHPSPERGGSRLLVLDRTSGALQHRQFSDLPAWLRAGDLLVLNDTRVIPARLIGRRLPGGGRAECLLLRRLDAEHWEALVHPGQRLRAGGRIVFDGEHGLTADVVSLHFHGRRIVRLSTRDGVDPLAVVEAIGHVPLPPYIARSDTPDDRERYQTVFAATHGSVAAPTAGLHFTAGMLADLQRSGVEVAYVTLHVGYGTFGPVRVDDIEAHEVEAERFTVDATTAAALTRARAEERRVLAVGTTVTRTLETVALVAGDGEIAPSGGETTLFIRPGHRFALVDGLLTNFHLPKSSLLMLVAAFAGRDRVLAAYRAAVAERYRFYSYGDAMLIV